MPSDVGFLSLFGDVNKALYEMTADKDAARSLLFKVFITTLFFRRCYFFFFLS